MSCCCYGCCSDKRLFWSVGNIVSYTPNVGDRRLSDGWYLPMENSSACSFNFLFWRFFGGCLIICSSPEETCGERTRSYRLRMRTFYTYELNSGLDYFEFCCCYSNSENTLFCSRPPFLASITVSFWGLGTPTLNYSSLPVTSSLSYSMFTASNNSLVDKSSFFPGDYYAKNLDTDSSSTRAGLDSKTTPQSSSMLLFSEERESFCAFLELEILATSILFFDWSFCTYDLFRYLRMLLLRCSLSDRQL